MEPLDLTIIWAGLIAFAVFAYVVMDGFDLGIGILFPGFTVGEERDQDVAEDQRCHEGEDVVLNGKARPVSLDR